MLYMELIYPVKMVFCNVPVGSERLRGPLTPLPSENSVNITKFKLQPLVVLGISVEILTFDTQSGS